MKKNILPIIAGLLLFFSCTQEVIEDWENDEKAYRFGLDTVEINDEITLSQARSFTITLENQEDYEQTFQFSTEENSGFSLVFEAEIKIEAKGKRQIEISVKPGVKGHFKRKLYIASRHHKKEILIDMTITQNQEENGENGITCNESYYTKNIESLIKINIKNTGKHWKSIVVYPVKMPHHVLLDIRHHHAVVDASSDVTIKVPYVVTGADIDTATVDFIVNINGRKNYQVTATLWDVTAKMVSLAADEETKAKIDLTKETANLRKLMKDSDYPEANKQATAIIEKLANFAGVTREEPKNDMYFTDADEPDVRIEVPAVPAIFTDNVGEFRIIATENPQSAGCDQSGKKNSWKVYTVGEKNYFLQRNGAPFIPSKKFVKGMPVLDDNGNETGISYFFYKKKVEFSRESHTSSGGCSGYEPLSDFTARIRKETSGYWALCIRNQHDSSGELTACTYELYTYESAVKFEVTEEADDSREFLSELSSVPTKRLVIFTHGTLFYKWVPDAKQHGNYYMFCEDGEANTAKFFKQEKVAAALNLDYDAGDKSYYFNWSGENNYAHRDQAAEALERFIYAKVAENLFYCNASQIVLIGHSHGVTVNNITMRQLQTDKMEKFAGEIPFVVGLNGIGKSTGSTGDNEKSNRNCFEFPEKTFSSLDGDSKVKMFNFYESDDGVVPPAFDDTIVFPYNYKEEYVVLETLNYVLPALSALYATIQAVRLLVCAGTSGVHNENRTDAKYVDNATQNISERRIWNNSHQDFYAEYMNPSKTAFNLIDFLVGLGTEPNSSTLDPIPLMLTNIPNILFLVSPNGDWDRNLGNGKTSCLHQLPRIQNMFTKCISEHIPQELLQDKNVDFNYGGNE